VTQDKSVRIIIENILTVTMNPRREVGSYTLLIENGRIARLSKKPVGKKRGDCIIDGKGKVAIPGLINGHIHCDVALARGLGDGLSLYQQDHDSFVSMKGWFTNELDAEARHISRILQYAEAVKGGTTFICDVPFWHYGDELVQPFREVGVSGALVLDYRKNFLTKERVEKEEYFQIARRLKDNAILPIVEAPAEEDFSEELLVQLSGWALELDTFLHLHLAETQWRIKIINEKFNTTSVRFLKDIGVLSDRIIGSHGVYIDDDETAMIRDEGARIINCPTAEMKIADGIAPVAKFAHSGIKVGMGTDGALWNDSSDMLAEMKTLLLVQRVKYGASSFDAQSALHAATLGGAKVFGLEKELGSIERGKRASIAIIDCARPHLVPLYHGTQSNALQLITSCANAHDVDTVIVDGDVVVERGKIKTVDERTLMQKAQELGEKRFSRLR
jgi:5-methylthioadenosine/S-adenosylhomocysteine deaminase